MSTFSWPGLRSTAAWAWHHGVSPTRICFLSLDVCSVITPHQLSFVKPPTTLDVIAMLCSCSAVPSRCWTWVGCPPPRGWATHLSLSPLPFAKLPSIRRREKKGAGPEKQRTLVYLSDSNQCICVCGIHLNSFVDQSAVGLAHWRTVWMIMNIQIDWLMHKNEDEGRLMKMNGSGKELRWTRFTHFTQLTFSQNPLHWIHINPHLIPNCWFPSLSSLPVN